MKPNRFDFDLDGKIQKLRATHANPANPANQRCNISEISGISSGIPQKLKNENFLQEIKKAGVSSRWQDYLMERLEILIKYESYSPEKARNEVLAMAKLPFYQGLN